MAYVLGAILLLSIVAFVWYAVKGKNLVIGFFLLVCLWFVIGLVGNEIIREGEYANSWFAGKRGLEAILAAINQVFQQGPMSYGSSTLVNIFFGAFFGQVLIRTNIANTVLKKTVELSGDKPRITLTAIMIITTLLFINMTGIGPVMAIAVIVFPILKTIGVPTPIAFFGVMGAICAGIMSNPVNFAQYHGLVLLAVENGGQAGILSGEFVSGMRAITYGDWSTSFGWLATGVCLFVAIVVTNFSIGFRKKTYYWAVETSKKSLKKGSTDLDAPKDAPWYSWLTIIIPGGLLTLFNMLPGYKDANGVVQKFTAFSIIFAFVIASLYAMISTKHMKGGFGENCVRITKYFTAGIVDVAPMIGFLLCLSMFGNVGAINAPYLGSVVGGLFPSSTLGLAVVFAVISIAGFFRGPTNLVGAGGTAFVTIVIVGVGSAMSSMSPMFVYALFGVLTYSIMHYCITVSWIAWGLGYTGVTAKQHMKRAIPTGYFTAIVLCLLAWVVLAR